MAEWLKEEIGTGPLAGMFRRGGEIVHCPRIGEDGYIPPVDDRDDDGPSQIRAVTDRTLASRIQYTYGCVKIPTARGSQPQPPVPAMFPISAARVAVYVPDLLNNLRRLRGVIHSPIIRRDGSVLCAPGYDEATHLLYLPELGLTVPAVPERPTDLDIAEAVDLLDEMVGEFDFVSKSDRANYYGLLLTPLLRELVPSPYKLGAIGAPQPGSGKTLLATCMRIVHGGVFRAEMPSDDAELKKNITTILDVTTAPVIHIDNVSGVLRSSALAGLLTSAIWEDRRLGSNTQITAANDRLWILTGNNLAIGGDLLRRTVLVTIDPGVPDPHLRTKFRLPNLEEWTRANRGRLLAALLTLVRAWIAAGSPGDAAGSDGYAQWITTVDGILTHAGIEGRFDDRASARQTIGEDDSDWREFLEAAHSHFGQRLWTAKELLSLVDDGRYHEPADQFAVAHAAQHPIPLDALPAELVEKAARTRAPLTTLSKSLGRWLRNRDRRWAGGLTVRSSGRNREKVTLWQVQTLGNVRGLGVRGVSAEPSVGLYESLTLDSDNGE